MKTLSSLKSFVLNFRKEFVSKNPRAHETTSLSLLVSAMAVRFLQSETAIETAERVYSTTKNSLRNDLIYELLDVAGKYRNDFELILKRFETSAICQDPLAFGYIYQYWRDSDRKTAQAEIQSAGKRIDKDSLIAFTQIYTPEWVVHFILANTLETPDSKWRIATRKTNVSGAGGANPNATREARPGPPASSRLLTPFATTVIDPACGAGNFLIPTFDALLSMRLATGETKQEAINEIFANQLYGVDIDAIALSVAATALVCRALAEGLLKVPVLNGLALAVPDDEPILGSLSESFPEWHPLSKRYDVVVTNPPYIGRKLNSRELKTLLKSRFPESHHDLSAAFFQRCLTLLKEGGRTGLITQASVMFLPSFSRLRKLMLDQHTLIAAVDAGPGVFPLQGGEKVNSAILIVEKPEATTPGADAEICFLNIKPATDKEEALLEQIARTNVSSSGSRNGVKPFFIPAERFKNSYGHALNYFVPDAVVNLLAEAPTLASKAEIRQGLATTNNDRFVKLIWQVPHEEIGRVWKPYVKGAGGQRFYSPIKHVVNWQDNGASIKESVARRYPYLNGKTEWVVKNESFYFRKGLCFSFVNTRGVAVRRLPAGCIFDVGASAIFSEDDDFLLGYLNSSLMVALANSLNPTINYQVGDLKRLPVVTLDSSRSRQVAEKAANICEVKEQLAFLIDPSSWFDPNTGKYSPHQFYSDLVESGIDSATTKFIASIKDMEDHLYAAEKQIDELVLDGIARSYGWSSAMEDTVRSWIDTYGVRANNACNYEKLDRTLQDNLLVHHAFKNGDGTKPANGAPGIDFGPTEGRKIEAVRQRLTRTFHGHPPTQLLHLTSIFS